MNPDDIDVSLHLRVKHGALQAAAKEAGSQAKLASRLGVSQQELGKWCNLTGCPPDSPTRSWTQERIDKLAEDLLILTGKSIGELFPLSLRLRCRHRNAKPIVFERAVRMSAEKLADLDAARVARSILPSPADAVADEEERIALPNKINAALKTLGSRQRQIIKLRFGLGGLEPMTLAEIARLLDRSPALIREIEQGVIRRLQRPGPSSLLSGFVPSLDAYPADRRAESVSPLATAEEGRNEP